MEREIFSRLANGLPSIRLVTPLTLYFDPIALKLPGQYSVETFPPPLKISIISDLISFSIDFPRYGVKFFRTYSFRSKVVLPAKRNMSRDQSERSKWSSEQAQNLVLHTFFSFLRDVPECCGMLHVPGFIDDLLKQRVNKQL